MTGIWLLLRGGDGGFDGICASEPLDLTVRIVPDERGFVTGISLESFAGIAESERGFGTRIVAEDFGFASRIGNGTRNEGSLSGGNITSEATPIGNSGRDSSSDG